MSELTAALETIFSWLKANFPKLEQSYQPGLSYEEIKSYIDTSRIVSKRQINISENDLFDPGDGTVFETLGFL